MTRPLRVGLACVLLTSACGTGQGSGQAGTVPTVTLPESPQVSSPAVEERVPSGDALKIEVGPLVAGTYETVNFRPTLRFQLKDDAWAGGPPDDPSDCAADGCVFGLTNLGEQFDQIHFPLVSFLGGNVSWIDPTQPFDAAQSLEPTPDPYEFFLDATHFDVTDLGTMSVAETEARWLEGTVVSAPEGSPVLDEAEGARWHNHVVAGHTGWFPVGESVRVIVADTSFGPLIIFIEAAPPDLVELVARTDEILGTLEIIGP